MRGESETATMNRVCIAVLGAMIAKKERIKAEVSKDYLDMKEDGVHKSPLGATGSAQRRGGLRHVPQHAHWVARAPNA